MGDNPVKGEVENFNRSSLKKTKTDEKQYKPTADGMLFFFFFFLVKSSELPA